MMHAHWRQQKSRAAMFVLHPVKIFEELNQTDLTLPNLATQD